LCATVACAVLAAVLAVRPAGALAASTQTCGPNAYRLALQSLTGPAGADLTVRVSRRTAGCPLPRALNAQITIAGRRVVNVARVASPRGAATIPLGQVGRRQRVAAVVTFRSGIALRGSTRTLLRPELVFRSVRVPRVVVSGQPFTVSTVVSERNPDLGATATVTVSNGTTVLGTKSAWIPARRRAVMNVPTTLQTLGPTSIAVTITSNPADTNATNNSRSAAVEVTEFKAVRSSVVTRGLAGYGSQFNENVYAELSRSVGVTDENVGDMEAKMRTLQPQFSRIFFTPAAFTSPDMMQSFIRTVLLAQSTGTTINVTWQGGRLDVASGTIQRFAAVLIDLVKNRSVTNLRWLTLQNEPNSTKMTPAQYEAQYRALDPYIASIRGQVRYMGGDLVRDKQLAWFDYLATHMADILDAYSIHVFWDYWDTKKLRDRLTEVRAIVDKLPAAARKPVYVTEYGVRGRRTFNGVPQVDPGVWENGTPITATNVSAFQHAWFDILSSQLGYVGTSKWDSYFAKYDRGTQAYWMIGPPQDGWPLYPLYNFMRLLTATVPRGWNVVKVDAAPGTTRLVTAYAGPGGQETAVGLDTAGAQLNTVSSTQVPYSVGGLPPSATLALVVWNVAGDGLTAPPTPVTTDEAGVASVTVPQNAVFALTTLTTPARLG